MAGQPKKQVEVRLKIKNGFYKEYRLRQEQAPKQSVSSIFRFDQQRKEWLIRLAKRIGKTTYYVFMFFLCSIGLSALLNASIRQILLQSLFGS